MVRDENPVADPYIPWGGSPPPRPPSSASGDTNPYAINTKISIDFPLSPYVDTGSRIQNVETIFIRLGTAATTTRIQLENNGHHGTRAQDHWNFSNPPEGSDVRIYLTINGVDYVVFTGIVTRVSSITRDSVTIELASRAEKYRRIIGTILTKDDYTNLPDTNVGLIMPWIWGAVDGFKPILVNDDATTVLSQAMLTSDTTAYVEDTSDFPSTGTIRINDEKITYTGTTSTSFTGLTRGVSSTEKGSHVAGNQVIEVGALEFLVCKHALTNGDITNVRYETTDGILVPVTPDSYTWTGPVIITFDEAPLVTVPSNTHKLKFIDLDTDVSSTCDNPTYAAGLHADFTEYNYATIVSGEYLELKRDSGTPVVEPSGEIIRMWAVVEYHLGDTTYTDTTVYFNGSNKGTLPEVTDTPTEIEEDHGIHTMSAGFEDAHTHTMPDGEHSHLIDGTGTQNITPDTDTGDRNTTDWGTKSEAYDGDWDTYAEVDLQLGGYVVQCYFPFLKNSEGLNFLRRVKQIRLQFKVGRKYNGTPPGGSFDLYWTVPYSLYLASWSGLGSDYTITLAEDEDFSNLPRSNPPYNEGGTTFDSGWVNLDDEGVILYAGELMNSWFLLDYHSHLTDEFCVFMMTMDLVVEQQELLYEEDAYFSYEPCGACGSPNMEDAFDLNWLTYESGFPPDGYFTWTSLSRPLETIVKYVAPYACGQFVATYPSVEENSWWMSIPNPAGGNIICQTDHRHDTNKDAEKIGATVQFYDLTSYNVTGAELLQAALVRKKQGMPKLVEVGCWVVWDDSGMGTTSKEDVGDTDEQEGNRSSLGWFDITDEGDYDGTWQYPVNKSIKVSVGGSDGEVKVLRSFFAAEFASTEKKIVRTIVCDVDGRDGGRDNIITDVLTESDLIGLPSAYTSVPTLAGTMKGALLEPTDGWLFMERILKECICQAYWSWSGVFTVKDRPAKGDLGNIIDTFTYSFTAPKFERKGLEDLVNEIEVLYNYNYLKGTMADNLIEEDATSQTKYGVTKNLTFALQFVRGEAQAQTWAQHTLSYMAECFDLGEISVGLTGFNVSPAELWSINVDTFSAIKFEVKELRIGGMADPRKLLTVTVKGTDYGQS